MHRKGHWSSFSIYQFIQLFYHSSNNGLRHWYIAFLQIFHFSADIMALRCPPKRLKYANSCVFNSLHPVYFYSSPPQAPLLSCKLILVTSSLPGSLRGRSCTQITLRGGWAWTTGRILSLPTGLGGGGGGLAATLIAMFLPMRH